MSDPTRPRAYYSARKYGTHASKLSIEDLRVILSSAFSFYRGNGYFVEAFGYECVDDGYVPGFVGGDMDVFVRMTLFKSDLWPLEHRYLEYNEKMQRDALESLLKRKLQEDVSYFFITCYRATDSIFCTGQTQRERIR